jgi:plastocyanin
MHRHCDSAFHPRSSYPAGTHALTYGTVVHKAALCTAAILFTSAAILFASAAAVHAADNAHAGNKMSGAADAVRNFMPDAAASKIVTVASGGTAAASIVVLTEAVAVKETGPKATVAHFGEVYEFSPSFIAVHRDEPTRMTLWNLQPDDEHDFMIEDPALHDRPGRVLMHLRLAPLSKISYIYTFHREGLFDFRCAVHQPEMSGQILVLPPR